jgi:hypothetical protein
MRKTTLALSALLVAQLGLAVGLSAWTDQGDQGKPAAPLVPFDTAAADGLTIAEPGQPALTLRRQGKDHWILPAAANAPADDTRVDSLLRTLADLKGGWPMARSADAAKRFKVADQDFEKHIQVTVKGKTVADLFVGTSPAYRLADVRVAGQNAIHTVPLGTYDLTTKPGDWEDKSLLRLKAEDIARIDLPDVALVRDKTGLAAPDLAADEEMVPDAVSTLENELATPLYDSLLPPGDKPEYGLDHPVMSATLTLKDGTKRRYDLGKRTTGDDYVLRVSGQTFLFQVPRYAVDELIAAKRATLIRHKGADQTTDKNRNAARDASSHPAPKG